MKINDKNKTIIFIVAIIVIIGGFLIVKNLTKTTEVSANFQKEEWEEIFQEKGSEEAYKIFKTENQKISQVGEQHGNAHLIGEIIYNQEGLDGLTICDKSFSFGCYHSFFIKAISEQGLNIIPELDQICIDEYGSNSAGCQHGIGHGIMQYMGKNNLKQAIEACEETNQPNELSGCPAGLFMEYNLPVTFTPESIRMDIREINNDNPYAPCNTEVPEKFQEACYFQLPEWWNHIYKEDYENTMIKIMKLCDEIDNEKFENVCFLASGNVASFSSNYQLDTVLNKCSIASKKGETLCRIGASHRLSNIKGKEKDTEILCEGIEKYKDYTCHTN